MLSSCVGAFMWIKGSPLLDEFWALVLNSLADADIFKDLLDVICLMRMVLFSVLSGHVCSTIGSCFGKEIASSHNSSMRNV